MKTKSIWGNPPKRIYDLIKRTTQKFKNNCRVCIVGCSDGKFLIPFARKKIMITGYDVDKIDLYGGIKERPNRPGNPKFKYSPNFVSNDYELETIKVLGISKRIEMENLEEFCNVEERDFYKNPPELKFDVVFTSCSLHYTINNAFTLQEKIETLKEIVKEGGILYIDYMMAIDENDIVSFPKNKFFRNKEIIGFFDDKWKIIKYYEQKKPVFEAGHVVTTKDHFHRFGYIMAERVK